MGSEANKNGVFVAASARAEAKGARRALPPRYEQDWREPFDHRVETSLKPGMWILDAGSGRSPVLLPHRRPDGCHYVGLDISEVEMRRAPVGSYDELCVADIVNRLPALQGQFDLVVSWQVLEHVKPLDIALENIRSYLKPGGRLIAQMSGTFSAFGVINQALPPKLGLWFLEKLLHRQRDTVFPAYYHHCWYGALARALRHWHSSEIVPRYGAGSYLRFSPLLQTLYLHYEDWAEAGGHRNLASHYLIDARR